jgi:hypothetical protein
MHRAAPRTDHSHTSLSNMYDRTALVSFSLSLYLCVCVRACVSDLWCPLLVCVQVTSFKIYTEFGTTLTLLRRCAALRCGGRPVELIYFSSFFPPPTQLVNNYNNSLDHLSRCQKKKKPFQQFLMDANRYAALCRRRHLHIGSSGRGD